MPSAKALELLDSVMPTINQSLRDNNAVLLNVDLADCDGRVVIYTAERCN